MNDNRHTSTEFLFIRWAYGDYSKCARHSAGWKVYIDGWHNDVTFKFTCDNPPVPTAEATTTANPTSEPSPAPFILVGLPLSTINYFVKYFSI